MTRLAFLFLTALAGAALAGCDDAIESPDSLQGTYTLWGALNPQADVQSVRVVPVRDTISLGSAAPLPVTVVSVDLETGAETAWRDSVVTFRDGTVGHIFNARLQPAYGSRHRLVVRRDEGGEVSAVVAVPALVQVIRQTVQTSGGLRYPILLPDAPQLNRVRVTYKLTNRAGSPVEVTRPIAGVVEPVEFGWQILLDVALDDEAIQAQADGEPRDFALREIVITGEVASEDWRPPGGVFDIDVLADPQSLSNVRGGFGFVGAAYPFEVTIRPTPCEIARTSFSSSGSVCTP
ncbi:MAG TPA: hypothetical protein VGB53_08675 [Rubricoccaceae bacterium]|jgi:hypothetical protein